MVTFVLKKTYTVIFVRIKYIFLILFTVDHLRPKRLELGPGLVCGRGSGKVNSIYLQDVVYVFYMHLQNIFVYLLTTNKR